MEKEIRLYGPLAKFIGQRKFLAEISSAGEAIRMLLANFPGLERHMADQYYKVIVDSHESDLGEVHYPVSQTIKIVPVLGGAGGGVGKIIAGAALIAISLALPGGGLFGGTAFGIFGGPVATAATWSTVATAASYIGAALILGGVSQLLSPTPQLGQIGPASMNPGGGRSTTSEGTELDPQESYSFSGIQNTSRQGTPVPVVYGETIVGSVVISAGIDVDTI
jgi:predicted phage tail protein